MLRSKAEIETPVGAIWFIYGTTAPPGWLLCDGGSTTGYAALAAQVGATVPDLRGRIPIGVGTGSGLTARVLGTNYGAETVTLVTANMASHNHGGGAHTHGLHTHSHTSNSHGHSANSHTHTMSHDHGPHSHQGTVMVGAGWGHTHNAVGGEVSSYTNGGGYFTGVYMGFANSQGYASFSSGATNSHVSEAPETNTGANGATTGGSAAPISAQGSATALGIGLPTRGLTAIIKT